MRLTQARPRRVAVLAALALIAAGVAAAVLARSHQGGGRTGTLVAVAGEKSPKPVYKPETRRELGHFRLRKGRTVSLSTADTTNGMECLIEDDDSGDSSSCLVDGLFAARKAEIVVSTMGGPGQFDELNIAGVVAPSIRSAIVVKSNGVEVPLELNTRRAFVYESPDGDLAARVYPTAIRLLGPSGKLVETLTFPPAG